LGFDEKSEKGSDQKPCDDSQQKTARDGHHGIGHIGSKGIVDHLLHVDDSHKTETDGYSQRHQKQNAADAQSKENRRQQ